MGNTSENKTKLFKGAGYLVGFAIGSAIAISFVAITGLEAFIGAIAGAGALPLGIRLEKKFQGKEPEDNSQEKGFLIAFIVFGFIFLVGFYCLAKFNR